MRLLFVMITTALLGLGTGYFLWGSRVARLTEALSTMTLESETMRARLAAPRTDDPASASATRTADELRVINEAIAAFRQELSEQKTLLQNAAPAAAAAVPLDAQACTAQLRVTRTDLDRCNADKQDLELRCGGQGAAQAPTYAPPAYAPPTYTAPAAPQYEAPATAPAPSAPPAYEPPAKPQAAPPPLPGDYAPGSERRF